MGDADVDVVVGEGLGFVLPPPHIALGSAGVEAAPALELDISRHGFRIAMEIGEVRFVVQRGVVMEGANASSYLYTFQ